MVLCTELEDDQRYRTAISFPRHAWGTATHPETYSVSPSFGKLVHASLPPAPSWRPIAVASIDTAGESDLA
ncbi:hypothetical protein ACTXKL_04175 [Brachybacterium tyrofermentans]|uniref:hypothetical protein n=1 Tax=Brachybacterium tyrofermentans TaxID=47848 RepID=UPI003FD42DCE